MRRSLSFRASSRREAFAAKLVVECGVECDGVPTVLGEGELGVRCRPDLDLVRADVDGVSVAELDPVPPVGFERTLDRRTVERTERGLDLAHELADAWPSLRKFGTTT